MQHFSHDQIQYRVKWLNFDRRHNRWTNEDDLDCDLLTARFEDCHEIVGKFEKISSNCKC